MVQDARLDQRIAITHPVKVRCTTWEEFIQLYTHNISRGGLFIQSSLTPPVGTTLQIRFSLPGGHELQLDARVAHVIDGEQSARERRKQGMGVQFSKPNDKQARLIQALIELAHLQKASLPEPAYQEPAIAVSRAPVPPPPRPQASQGPPPPPKPRPNSPVSGQDGQTLPTEKRGLEQAVSQSKNTVPLRSSPTGISEPPSAKHETLSIDDLFGDVALTRSKTGNQPIVSHFTLDTARQHAAQRRYEKAIQEFSQILAAQPECREAQAGLLSAQAHHLFEHGDHQRALEKAQALLDFEEDNPGARDLILRINDLRSSRGMFDRFLGRK